MTSKLHLIALTILTVNASAQVDVYQYLDRHEILHSYDKWSIGILRSNVISLNHNTKKWFVSANASVEVSRLRDQNISSTFGLKQDWTIINNTSILLKEYAGFTSNLSLNRNYLEFGTIIKLTNKSFDFSIRPFVRLENEDFKQKTAIHANASLSCKLVANNFIDLTYGVPEVFFQGRQSISMSISNYSTDLISIHFGGRTGVNPVNLTNSHIYMNAFLYFR